MAVEVKKRSFSEQNFVPKKRIRLTRNRDHVMLCNVRSVAPSGAKERRANERNFVPSSPSFFLFLK